MTRVLRLVLGGTVIALATASMAADPEHPTEATDANAFLVKAASGGIAEVELGRLALQRGSSPDVKAFGERMVNDHTQANRELDALAARKGVAVPKNLDREHTALRDRLSKLSGRDFDQAYMKEMTADHEQDVAEFRRASEGSKDPDVRAFAAQKLPTLVSHLDAAKRIENTLNGHAEVPPAAPTALRVEILPDDR